MDDFPSQSPQDSEVQALRSEVSELAAVLRLGLAGLFVLTGSMAIYLYRQNVLLARQVNAQAKVAVEADQKNRAIIGVVTEFQRFGWSHPDYATNVLTRFNLVPLPPTNAPAAEPSR
jgi:hypothetical protein